MSRAGAFALWAALAGCSGGREEPDFTSHADRSSYPDGPYGLDEGDTIDDYTFATEDGVLDLQALRADRRDRLLVVFGVQTWPNACAAEADYLANAYEGYQDRGVAVLGILVEAFETEPSPDAARSYFGLLHDAPYPYAADRDARFETDLAAHGMNASPVNVVVDLDTMQVKASFVGWSRTELEGHLTYAF